MHPGDLPQHQKQNSKYLKKKMLGRKGHDFVLRICHPPDRRVGCFLCGKKMKPSMKKGNFHVVRMFAGGILLS